MLRLPGVVVAPRKTPLNNIGYLPSKAFANNGADEQGQACADANDAGLETKSLGVDFSHAESRKDVDEAPGPGVEPERERNGWVFEHVEEVEEMSKPETSSRNHITTNIEEHLAVGALMGTVCQEVGIPRKESLGEAEQGQNKGANSNQTSGVKVPVPSGMLGNEPAHCVALE